MLVRGGGIAALTCGHLFERAGIPWVLERGERPRIPVLLLSGAALGMLRDVFDRHDLFDGMPPVSRRVVAWRRNDPAVTFPHSGIVLSEQLLLDGLEPACTPDARDFSSDWTAWSSGPAPAEARQVQFGDRTAWACAATLGDGADGQACWIEAVDQGWMFLIPGHEGGGWLLSIGAPPDQLLGRSRLISGCIQSLGRAAGAFPSHPRILDPLCGDEIGAGWMACGSAAMAFDPICGDGTANAVREAILLTACLRAISQGEPRDLVLQHYKWRLIAGFQRHLALCREFYATGGDEPWWQAQVASLEQGWEWCAGMLGESPQFRYALQGFELVRRC